MPTIRSVAYEAVFNLGNFQNEKIRLVADLNPEETPDSVIELLRERAHEMAHKEDVLRERHELRNALRTLNEQISTAREQWNTAREFLIAQGLRPDAPEFPIAAAAAIGPPVAEEEHVTEWADGEATERPVRYGKRYA